MDDSLPSQLLEGASIRDKEYAWALDFFPIVLHRAPTFGYACLGGQIWFLLADNSLYEPFWLEANAADRIRGEPWFDYVKRSCDEVLVKFNALVDTADFGQEAKKFESLKSSFSVKFNAYFVSEQQFTSLGLANKSYLNE